MNGYLKTYKWWGMKSELINKLKEISKNWNIEKDESSKNALQSDFSEKLQILEDLNWDELLGEKNELPDVFLSKTYIKRREARIELLEDELASLSKKYRQCTKEEEKIRVVEEYANVLEEMFFIGHWSKEPDVESQLPDKDMPQFYHDYWS